MGVSHQDSIDQYWNTDPEEGAIFPLISEAMSLKQWEQIHRYFYCSPHTLDPLFPASIKLRPFDKIDPLAQLLIARFQHLWKPGTHLTIDEAITAFTGRASETVNIPSKPTPEGFK